MTAMISAGSLVDRQDGIVRDESCWCLKTAEGIWTGFWVSDKVGIKKTLYQLHFPTEDWLLTELDSYSKDGHFFFSACDDVIHVGVGWVPLELLGEGYEG